MDLLFKMSPNGNMYLYIHCTSAGQQLQLTKKMHTHSEYNTKWSNLIEEWEKKEYFKYHIVEQMAAENSVITLIEFTNSRSEDFIKELSDYLEADASGGYYNIQYKSFIHNQ